MQKLQVQNNDLQKIRTLSPEVKEAKKAVLQKKLEEPRRKKTPTPLRQLGDREP